MNVYEFDFNVSYGGGIMLLAAPTRERAIEIVQGYPTRPFCGYWEYSIDRPDLTYSGNEGDQILIFTYVE